MTTNTSANNNSSGVCPELVGITAADVRREEAERYLSARQRGVVVAESVSEALRLLADRIQETGFNPVVKIVVGDPGDMPGEIFISVTTRHEVRDRDDCWLRNEEHTTSVVCPGWTTPFRG